MKDKEQLVSQNIGLVHFVIKRFGGKGQDMEELFQVGCVGLCKAVEGFKEELDLKFSTYAVPVILGEVKRFIRDNTQVHISRGMKEQAIKVKYAKERYEALHHKEPTLAELSKLTGIEMEDIVLAIDTMKPIESLDSFVNEEDSATRKVDLLSSEINAQEQVVNKLMCEEAFRFLNKREQEIMYLRYFENMTQSKVAGMLGMTQVQVSRAEKRILLMLRNKLS